MLQYCAETFLNTGSPKKLVGVVSHTIPTTILAGGKDSHALWTKNENHSSNELSPISEIGFSNSSSKKTDE